MIPKFLETLMDYQVAANRMSQHADAEPMHPMRRMIAAVGILGEAAEFGELMLDAYNTSLKTDFQLLVFDTGRMTKELGDVWWYDAEIHASYCDMSLHESYDENWPAKVDDTIAHLVEDGSNHAKAQLALYVGLKLVVTCSKISETIKKHVRDQGPVCFEDVGAMMEDVTTMLMVTAHVFEIDTARTLAENLVKLRKRYGERYNREGALHRQAGDT
jgi:NTP pyrophosphatase (non-canonical NTP hydrolase)